MKPTNYEVLNSVRFAPEGSENEDFDMISFDELANICERNALAVHTKPIDVDFLNVPLEEDEPFVLVTQKDGSDGYSLESYLNLDYLVVYNPHEIVALISRQ